MKRIPLLTAIASAFALVAGCAHAPPESSSGPSSAFSLNGASRSYTVAITPTSLTGADYQVTRTSDGLRGTVFNSPIELHWKDDSITGSYQGSHVKLKVENAGQGTTISGLYGGRLGNLRVDSGEIQGTMGACSYSLTGSNGSYSGQAACGGGGPNPMTVTLPPGLATSTSTADAAELAILLGG